MLQKRCFAHCCRICSQWNAKQIHVGDTTNRQPETPLFQASNEDRSLAASAAAKGLAAATDVALQQLMSPEDRVRE